MKDGNHVLYGHFGDEYMTLTRGDGVYVFDKHGQRFLDAAGGVCVVNIGYGVSEILDVMSKQAEILPFAYGGTVDNEPKQILASKLQDWAPPGMGETKTLFSSSGTEANEGAIRLAYQYHWERGNETKSKIIGRWQSYHGNTAGALAISGRTSWRKKHDLLLPDVPHIPPPYCYRCPWGLSYPGCALVCADELRRVISQEGPENIAAFIVEPIVGTSMSGVVPPPEYYGLIREICDQYDVLLIVDEVMTGIGRTGKKWGIDHWGVTPDIITSSKGISGGYAPLGAVILGEKVWKPIQGGSGEVTYGSTYGGNPLSCAVGVAVLNYIETHNLVERAGSMGEKLLSAFHDKLADLPNVGDIRGKGLLLGVELVLDKKTKETFPTEWNVSHKIEMEARNYGLIILAGVSGLVDGASGDHVEIAPPYIIDDDHVEFIASNVKRSIENVVGSLR